MRLGNLVEVLCSQKGPSIEKGPSLMDGPFQIKSGLRVFGFCPAGSTQRTTNDLRLVLELALNALNHRVGDVDARGHLDALEARG